VLDFGALAPEINSARMYAGPGAGSMLGAASAWQSLADELNSAAANYGSVIATLTSGPWTGPSSAAMAAAVAPYVTWLSATGEQAGETAAQATAAAGAYETAYAATVPPMVIAANRSLLAMLVATNFLGQNTPAIAATEAHYGEMWAQDAAAMYGYAGASATAAQVTPFATPPQTTNSGGLTGQAAGTSGGTDVETLMSSGPQLISGMPQTLQSLASPQTLQSLASSATDSTSSSSSTSSLSMLNTLSTPLRMATMPMSMLSRLFMTGSTANAARAVSTAANELGVAQSAGLGSSTSVLASTGFAGVGTGTPAISAGMGQASSVGALSVPSSWPAAPSTSAVAMPFGGTGAMPAAHADAPSAMPPMMPVTNLAGRNSSAAPSRFELRSTVIPFSPAGG
jgi:PPE-repeat protein